MEGLVDATQPRGDPSQHSQRRLPCAGPEHPGPGAWCRLGLPGLVGSAATRRCRLRQLLPILDFARRSRPSSWRDGDPKFLRGNHPHGTALSSTVERLKAAGHEVVIVQTVPHFAGDYPWNAAECTLFATLNGACTQEMPLQYALDRSAEVRSM